MRLKFFGLLFFTSLFLSGQEPDSLLAQYQSYPNDTAKVNLLYKKGFDLRNKDLQAAIKFSQACYQTAILAKNHFYMAKALNLQAVLKEQMGMHEQAALDFQKALQFFIQTRDTLSQTIVLNNLGNIYSNINDNEEAFNCYEKSLLLANSIEDDYWVRGAIVGIASLQIKMKIFEQAEGNFETLIHFAETALDYEMLLECYKNMGVCKLNLGDTLAAESYQLMVLDITEMMEDETGQADAYINLGEIYLTKKDFKEGFSCLQKALGIAQKNNYNEGLLKTWKNLSEYFKETKKFNEAYFYLTKHDSALMKNNSIPIDNLSVLWNENSTEVKAETSFSVKNIFQLLLIGAVILILGFVLIRMGNEQKGQKK